MQATHTVSYELKEPSVEITRAADGRKATFRPNVEIKNDDAKLWSELFGELRAVEQGKPIRLPVLAIRLAVEFIAELLDYESAWTPHVQLRIDFVQLCRAYVDYGFPWEGGRTRKETESLTPFSHEWLFEARKHFRGRLSNIYCASGTIYLSSHDDKVVWEIPKGVLIHCDNEAQRPRLMTSRYFLMPRDEPAYRKFLIRVLVDEVRRCDEGEKVELYVLGRQGHATLSHLREVSASVAKVPAIKLLFERHFSSWFFFITDGKKKGNVAEHILDTRLEQTSIVSETLEYADATPVVQGILMLRWSRDLTIECSHLFIDFWHRTDKFCYRYFHSTHVDQSLDHTAMSLEHAAGTIEIPGVYSYMLFYGEVVRHFCACANAGTNFRRIPNILTLHQSERVG